MAAGERNRHPRGDAEGWRGMMRHLDLFSGIGGFALALERAGLARPVGFVEIDPYCRRVLAKHWPDVPIYEDVTTREFHDGEADIITGGFPCQDISLAGEGAGLAGSRSGLWRELLRAIRVVRPRYAIVENVSALLGRGMGTVLGDLASVGYDAEWHCIPASAVGAPHRRDRVWIIAHPGGEQHEGDCAPFGGEVAAQLSWASASSSTNKNRAFVDSMCVGHGRKNSRVCAGWDSSERSNWWSVEPAVDRMANGVPGRVDRLRGLGNAIVPQVAEVIARAIKLREFDAVFGPPEAWK